MKQAVFLRPSIKERSKYFSLAKDEIARYNINTLVLAASLSLTITLLFFVISPYIVKGWKVTKEYLYLLPMFTVFILISTLYRRKEVLSFSFVQVLCILFYSCLMLNFVLISVIPYPDMADSFVGLFIIIMPTLLILRQYQVLLISLIFGGLNIFLSMKFKTGATLAHDVFTTMAAILFSQAVSIPIFSLRLQNFHSQLRLQRISATDHLSGLSNKLTVETRARQMIENKNPPSWALAILDIDDFKRINDIFGHQQGDNVISVVGHAIQTLQNDSVYAGRIGGDEFLIAFENITSRDDLIRTFEKARREVTSICSENYGLHLTVSVGICFGDNTNPTTFAQAFADADQALYQAKAKGKDTYIIFS